MTKCTGAPKRDATHTSQPLATDDAFTDAVALYKDLTNGIPGAIFQYILHPDGRDRIAYMSQGASGLWELDSEQLEEDPSPLWKMVVPEDVVGLQESVKASAQSLGYWSFEWRIVTPSGKMKWLSGTGMPRRKDNGDVVWNSVVIDVTQERHNQRALDSFFEHGLSLHAIVDLSGRFVRVNQHWTTTLGYAKDELEGHLFMDFVHPQDIPATRLEMERKVDAGEGSVDFENRYRHRDGSYRLLSWCSVVSREEGLVYAVAVDITDVRKAENKLRQSAAVFQSAGEGVMITDQNGRILEVNKAFTKITGYSQDDVVGQTPAILRSGRHEDAFYRHMWHEIKTTGNWHGEIWNRHKDGHVYPELLTISAISDNQHPTGYVGVFSDISTLKAHQEKLDHIAHHDPLTQLPNRLLLHSRLSQSLRLSARKNSSLAVIFIDLDRFKHINDSMGHHVGDALLVQVAERLLSSLRSSDTVARLSGDEFVVLLEDIDGPEHVAQVTEHLLNVFKDSFILNDMEVSITASMGISLYPQDAVDQATLMANADAAMYRAKERGKNTYLFYSSEFTAQAYEFVYLENALRKALSDEQFYLVYQPQFANDGQTLTGMETLLRWQHPQDGPIAPSRFIPIAEQNGTIREIGKWVLRTACQQARIWLDQGLFTGRLAVNISAPQFYAERFVTDVLDTLKDTAFLPHHLELEVTESCLMMEPEKVIEKLNALRLAGISVAIDDFGTGYSSLSYLKKLPVDKLKIDKAFIAELPHNQDDKAITEAVLGLGVALNLRIIAEGVEKPEHVTFLSGKHCAFQGYYFSKPLAHQEMTAFLQQQQAPASR